MITKYRHTGLVVNNLSKSRKFYCELLNFKIIQNPGADLKNRDRSRNMGCTAPKML